MINRFRQQGIALVMVMWFVAAMALLVGGIMASGKIDRQGTDAGVFSAKAIALGDGAIRVALTEYLNAPGDKALMTLRELTLDDTEVQIKITNGANFVNINTAREEPLTQLLALGVPMDPAEAQLLATSIVAYRQGNNRYEQDIERPHRFLSIEELLLAPGISRATFDALRDLVCACESSGATLNPDKLALLIAARDQFFGPEDNRIPLSAEQMQAVLAREASGSEIYRVDAVVKLANRRFLRRHWVMLSGSQVSRLGWQSVQTDPIRILGRT